MPQASVQFVQGDAYALPALPTLPTRPFDACFAGFWWSHVPRSRLPGFLRGLHATLRPGARVVFLDNRWVAGSSTPLADTDAEGNTFQCCRLRVLKNFPTPDEVRAQVHGMASDVQLDTWPHDWALAYRVN